VRWGAPGQDGAQGWVRSPMRPPRSWPQWWRRCAGGVGRWARCRHGRWLPRSPSGVAVPEACRGHVLSYRAERERSRVGVKVPCLLRGQAAGSIERKSHFSSQTVTPAINHSLIPTSVLRFFYRSRYVREEQLRRSSAGGYTCADCTDTFSLLVESSGSLHSLNQQLNSFRVIGDVFDFPLDPPPYFIRESPAWSTASAATIATASSSPGISHTTTSRPRLRSRPTFSAMIPLTVSLIRSPSTGEWFTIILRRSMLNRIAAQTPLRRWPSQRKIQSIEEWLQSLPPVRATRRRVVR
jgi:hypothetical protein